MKPEIPGAFEVLDLFDGLFQLTRRSPVLDGSVPLRVAQACVPHLAGNAYGFQVNLTRGFRVRKGLFAPRLFLPEGRDHLEALMRSALVTLRARGWLGETEAAFKPFRGPWCEAVGRHRIRLFTGLLVRPAPGTCLRLTDPGNRRNTRLKCREGLHGPSLGFEPVVLELELDRGGASDGWIGGELATLAPLQMGLPVEEVELENARDLAEAHRAFYDREYFETKKSAVAGKYRRMVSAPEDGPPGSLARLARFGPASLERSDLVIPGGGVVHSWLFRNPVPFTVVFDGQNVLIDHEKVVLKESAAAIERSFSDAMGKEWGREHLGWLWYLTKYFTPHPPGEPHFFVKAWGFLDTPAGWRTLLDGIHGPGYDVLRGVVETSRFHALPAVFKLHTPGKWVRIEKGTPLLRILPFPWVLEETGFQKVDLG